MYHNGPIPKSVRQVTESLQTLPFFLCHKDDIVLLTQPPSIQTQSLLQLLGFHTPELCYDPQKIRTRTIQKTIAWGKSPKYPNKKWTSQDQKHYSKSYGAMCLADFVCNNPHPLLDPAIQPGIYCTTMQAIQHALQTLQSPIVIKADFGASGRNAIRWLGKWEQGQKRWVERILRQQGGCVVESFLNKEIDFSIQLQIKKDGTIQKSKPQRFFTSPQGQYLGHWLGAFHKGLPTQLIQYLYKNNWLSLMDKVCDFVGQKMYKEGHLGAIGIDCLVHKKGNSYFIHPIVEINPRYTMGQVAIPISKRCMGPAIFSLSLQSHLPITVPQMKRGLCQSGHIRLNDSHFLVGIFLTVSTESCQQWCEHHKVLHPPV